VTVKRSYDSSRRQRQAAQTRADILDAARRLFADRGYPATTIEAVAAEAEVSPATVYSIFGSKRGLLAAFQEFMHAEVGYDERRRQLDAAADPATQIAAGVRISLSFPRRYGDVMAAMLSARGVDPEIDEFLDQGLTRGHRGGWGILAARLAATGALRPGLTEKEAGDLGSALTRPEIYRLLASEYGWPHERIEDVLSDTLRRALLP
jgi:AcrR family transcriptional regulator